MSNYRKVNNDSSDSELDSGDDERVLPSASVQNATDEPATKRSRCVWTDVALEQSLEMHRTLVTDGKECNIDRGSESYSAIKTQYRDDFVRDFDDNGNVSGLPYGNVEQHRTIRLGLREQGQT
ncbi:hypothetical protein L596_025605 [Steinernema carpocapsae]|uniref:Uncharacterized protein n=1 Tax=Steinernema carpocapsae TaxID=34508 RepID=A0A4U5M897_STECR|nr:hypothetical protein L596_025605 [Steinernema carpocapsae]